jgi:ubiquinone/menaquinone biosynthesis C-methylase UbiE
MSYIMDSPSEGQRIERKTDRVLTERQLEWVGVCAAQKVLDLGCAAGTTCRILAERVGPSGSVVGIDGSAARLAEAQRHPDHRAWIQYRPGQAEALPAADGEFDVAWARFLFEYLREPGIALQEMVRVTKPGGTVAVADLDGNCTWHHPYPAHLAAAIEQALSDLASNGFDPSVGRKLYHLAWEVGLTDIQVDVRPYHLIAGRVDPRAEALWDHKLQTVCDTLAKLGWSQDRAQKLYQGFMDHLRDESSFTYSVLITVKGQRPV